MFTVGVLRCTCWQICSGVAWPRSSSASSTNWRCGVIRIPRWCSVSRSAARPLSTPPMVFPCVGRLSGMRVLAKLDGTIADIDAPQVTVDDMGLLRGDGIFETILVVDGNPRELGPHLDRLARSAALLNLPEPD